MTPTPKSPEEILEEFVRSKTKIEYVMKGTEEIAWLRSSLASVLYWASEQLPQTWHSADGKHYDGSHDDAYELGLSNARSILIEKVKEIEGV